jgi:predicted nucleic acid-binding Zn ribbon protein
MPAAIDPAWEYWEPDPEVAEAMGAARLPGFAALGIEDRRAERAGSLVGVRFGRGNPDACRFRLAPERPSCRAPSRCRRVPCPGCGAGFDQLRPDRAYCSRRCAAAVTTRARRVRPAAVACPGCGAAVRPLFVGHRYCSRACAGRRGGGVGRIDYGRLAALFDAGAGMGAIAAAVGATPSACRKALKKLGRAMRPPGRKTGGGA